jgi:hypothetical protein
MLMRRAFMLAVAIGCASAVVVGADQAKPKPSAANSGEAMAKSVFGKAGFDGKPTQLVACVGGQYYNIHNLGFAPSGSRVKLDVISGDNIDPMATMMVLQMGPNAPNQTRSGFVFDDDSGGGRDPRIETTTSYDGNVILAVGSYDGVFGCYIVKMEITVP